MTTPSVAERIATTKNYMRKDYRSWLAWADWLIQSVEGRGAGDMGGTTHFPDGDYDGPAGERGLHAYLLHYSGEPF